MFTQLASKDAYKFGADPSTGFGVISVFSNLIRTNRRTDGLSKLQRSSDRKNGISLLASTSFMAVYEHLSRLFRTESMQGGERSLLALCGPPPGWAVLANTSWLCAAAACRAFMLRVRADRAIFLNSKP